jgi:hypothetical protein
LNFLNSFEVAAIFEFEIETKEILNLPGLLLPAVNDWWAKATSPATSPLTEVKIDEVTREWPAGGQARLTPVIRRSHGGVRVRNRTRALRLSYWW